MSTEPSAGPGWAKVRFRGLLTDGGVAAVLGLAWPSWWAAARHNKEQAMNWLQRVGAAVALAAVLGLGLGALTVTSVSFHAGAASRATTVIAVQAGHKTKKHKKKHKKAKAVKAAYPAACAAKADASAGSWSSAESEYVVAETQAVKNLGAVTVFASLGLDAGTVALDQVGGTSTTSTVATYNRDVAAGKQWFKGCK